MTFYENFLPEYFSPVWFALIFTILTLASFLDIKTRKIPNWLTFGGILMMFGFLFFSQDFSIFLEHLWGFLIGSFIFITFFLLRIWGGGDSKLMIFLSLSFGIKFLAGLCFWIFMAGGFQAFIFLLFLQKKTLPYAVPITLGTLGYVLSGFFL